ncbi:formyltetrahydrofolate deformylase [Ilumatobacter coccineus]|jgi:formyltetrahydrofolate deformylase|uniref:Formyltetrahydrofolate deformylase n=1 Tax=Ilumatobacter coccineus (strain NBRC 103263 / KCTC 29153 / YM16-304) TaxID=1313172 RepID=A0A6C7EEU0_ILUCY|nr:formyltetrahydrofolate deformylase [Ilumatobacter coccineus]BAN03138.1 formyltetrahydrofolate deformylase [Ilumatobacter coccineus YM16-304]
MSSVLLLSCPDQQGVVAATAEFIADQGGNIVHAEQYVKREADADGGVFFQRVVFDLVRSDVTHESLLDAIRPLADKLDMTVDLRDSSTPIPTAIMCSKQGHCLYDLLTRWRSGEMPMDLRVVISNHPDHADIAGHMGVPFVHLPVTKETKPQQEAAVLATLAEYEVDLVVMARYMQILSDDFVSHYPMKIINIHHSFLPAFIGANPYRQAHERGVKLIGATAHYATADLDEGPIISQDTTHVSHRENVAELTARGRDVETVVLARAVRAHLEHRVAVHGHQTIVYN